MLPRARRFALPNRIRYPTDCQFASSCSPPHLTMTQLLSATTSWHTSTMTFTSLTYLSCERTGIENILHWRIDVILREDASRIRKGNAPGIMTSIRHLLLNLFQKDASKLSLAKKRKMAAWDGDFRAKLLFAD